MALPVSMAGIGKINGQRGIGELVGWGKWRQELTCRRQKDARETVQGESIGKDEREIFQRKHMERGGK